MKPEPHNEIPTGASAHDTFWDFVSLTPESAHMVMWLMSDRAIPIAYRNMQGFGVHTFRLVNAAGESVLVKFHWRPKSGTCSLVGTRRRSSPARTPTSTGGPSGRTSRRATIPNGSWACR